MPAQTHSRMLTTRRRKRKNEKRLAREAKLVKRLGKQGAKADGAEAAKKGA